MKRRYILSLEAGFDLINIWRHIGSEARHEMADRVESALSGGSFTSQRTPDVATGERI